jgi:fructan beta-fructosidase
MRFPNWFPFLGLVAFSVLLSVTACERNVDLVFMDFEGSDYGDWQVTGDAFGSAPASSSTENQENVTGFKGKGFANSFLGGEESRGTLTSPNLVIHQPFINFLIGGATRPEETCMDLWIDGEIVRSASGQSSRYLVWSHWNVSEWEGKNAQIEIVDNSSGGGHVFVDHIVLSSRPYVRPDLKREIKVEKDYLNFPVKTGVLKRRMRIVVEGELFDDFDIELAEGSPDFWVFVDLSRKIGKKAVLQVTQPWESDRSVLDRIAQSEKLMNADTLYKEKNRPQFHFTSRRGWNNDPNGLVFYAGEYHLFYQHNPYGWNWGNMHWGHAVSPDLVHWEDLGDAIFPDELGTVFSGSAVVDWRNSAGFQEGGEKTIVCFYTSAGSADAIKEVPFTQSIAYSTDKGRTFEKYAGNPIIGHIIDANRDPKVIWNESSQQWIMALYMTKNDYSLFASKDLKDWQKIGDIRIPGCSECPDIFDLPIDGDPGKTKWVFWGANGSYVLGTFDGEKFRQESESIRLYAGGTAYAAQSFSDIPESDGRRIQICWLRCAMPGMPFNQQMGFPVELTLRTTEGGIRMFSVPVREIANIRSRKFSWESLVVKPEENPLSALSGDLFEIQADFAVANSKEFGFSIRGITVTYNSVDLTLSCQGDSVQLRPMNGCIRLQILVDRASIEIFGNDGRVYMPVGMILPDDNKSLEVFAKGAAVSILRMDVYELNSTWNTAAASR